MNGVNKYHWMSWIGKMVMYLRQDDLGATANMLACCLLPEDATDLDRWGAEKMFKHPALVGKHVELWAIMKPMVTTECCDKAFDDLKNYGWPIRREERDRIDEILTSGVATVPFDPETAEEVD